MAGNPVHESEVMCICASSNYCSKGTALSQKDMRLSYAGDPLTGHVFVFFSCGPTSQFDLILRSRWSYKSTILKEAKKQILLWKALEGTPNHEEGSKSP